LAEVYAVVAAAGQSSRMAGADKQMLSLGGVPVLARSLRALESVPQVEGIVLSAHPDRVAWFRDAVAEWDLKKIKAVVPGGIDRQQSVFLGLLAVPFDCRLVIVHDGARPLVSQAEIMDLMAAAADFGAATLAVPVKDTVKVADGEGFVAGTPERQKLWLTQTPQGFSFPVLLEAHRRAAARGERYTDDASLLEACGRRVKIVQGSYRNIKITTPEDVLIAEALLRAGIRD